MDAVEKHIFWDRLIKNIEERVNVQSFNTWFRPLSLDDINDRSLVISVPRPYFSSWLEEHYLSLLQSSCRSILDRDVSIVFTVRETPEQSDPSIIEMSHAIPTGSGFSSRESEGMFFSGQLTVNPRFTFDSFVVGHSNRFAYTAAKAVAENPGSTAFNPLVIYGGVGLGKTHILQAISNHYLGSNKYNPLLDRIIYVSSEKFTMDFILSIKNKLITQYSKFYRNANILLVDDIQFFNNKESTQEEFFHIFNDLHQNGKQIVLTMDCPPLQLKGLADRLINRFQWGLVTDIQPPDFETRVAILKKKAEKDGVFLEDSISEYIAENITSNIRELEGSLIRLLAYSSLHGQDISLEMAANVLGDTIRKSSHIITIESIQNTVAEHFLIPNNLIAGESRKKEVASARHIAMYLSKQLTASSLKTIGLHFGGRDHSTVIHSVKLIERMMSSDSEFSSEIQLLIKKVKNHS